MIQCKQEECEHTSCCIHCEKKRAWCCCGIALECNCDEETILSKCEFAEHLEKK